MVGKAAGFSGLILVTVLAFPSYADTWGPALAVLAALTMTVGNVAALRQRPDAARSAPYACSPGPPSARRATCWSRIAAAGYADRARRTPIGTTVAYALMYGVVNLGAFAVAALVARAPANRLDRLPRAVRLPPARRPRAGLLPALPGRAAARA